MISHQRVKGVQAESQVSAAERKWQRKKEKQLEKAGVRQESLPGASTGDLHE